MRTTLNLSDVKNKSAAVNEAIAESVCQRKLEQLKRLSGQIEIDENWKILRALELKET